MAIAADEHRRSQAGVIPKLSPLFGYDLRQHVPNPRGPLKCIENMYGAMGSTVVKLKLELFLVNKSSYRQEGGMDSARAISVRRI